MPLLNKTAALTPNTLKIIRDRSTEYPGSGCYNEIQSAGTYLCRCCGLALFRADAQFHSGCGWPAFDGAIESAVAEKPDVDGQRIEIVCHRCDAHLGHVFRGEYLTAANLRHCVNSASMDFVFDNDVLDTGEAILAGGCFWGVEYYLQRLPGVLKVESGYTGGHVFAPSYEQVCQGNSGHYEAVRVLFDVEKTTYEHVLKCFFEIHDPTQSFGQGPDRGGQYQSAVFFYDESQKAVAFHCIGLLRQNGFDVATQVLPVQIFWPAEAYHQNYYNRQGKMPYCHRWEKRF